MGNKQIKRLGVQIGRDIQLTADYRPNGRIT
jgi:hypothetical protein